MTRASVARRARIPSLPDDAYDVVQSKLPLANALVVAAVCKALAAHVRRRTRPMHELVSCTPEIDRAKMLNLESVWLCGCVPTTLIMRCALNGAFPQLRRMGMSGACKKDRRTREACRREMNTVLTAVEEDPCVAACVDSLHLVYMRLQVDFILRLDHLLHAGRFPHLSHLKLSCNALRDDGVAKLCASLGRCGRPITYMDLANNGVSDEGMAHVTTLLLSPTAPPIRMLGLAMNGIGDNAVSHLTSSLKKATTTLKGLQIDLRLNLIEGNCIGNIAEAIADGHLRCFIDASQNPMEDEDLKLIRRIMSVLSILD